MPTLTHRVLRPSRLPRLSRAAPLALALAAAGCGGSKDDRESADTASLAGSVRDRGVATSRADATSRVRGRDWPHVRALDTLVVVAPYNSTTYFVYKGEPLGYEYDLLKQFAEDHGVSLRLVVVQQRDSLLAMLADGRADVAAARLIPPEADTGAVAYTHMLYRTEPVLVQRKAPVQVATKALPKGADTMLKRGPAERAPAPPAAQQARAIQARLVQRPSELAGKRVTVPDPSKYEQALVELADSLTGDLQVVEVEASSEALIREVAKGNIAYTLAQGNLAELQGAYFKNLMVRPVVGPKMDVAWAVRRDARMLLDTLNAWIDDERRTASFAMLYKKYFVDARGYQTRVASRYLSSETGTLSRYDSLFKQHARALGWDWRLLASQAYQESKFDPVAKSWAGARGLLQLMPRTARQFGVRRLTDPRENVEGGVRYIQWLQKYWASRIEDEDERLRFILASYNAGAGHVEDAQRIAEKHGDDPKKWENVAYWMLQLSKAEYYSDPVVKYGFVRGLEPVTYVSLILDRFQHYKQFVQPGGVANE